MSTSTNTVARQPFIPRLISFVLWQAKDVTIGGPRVLLLKKIPMLLGLAPAVLVVLLVRMVRPLVLIRFGPLLSSKIGQLAGYTEVYLCERDAGLQGSRTLDIFYHMYMYHSVRVRNPVCNQQLKKMWERTLHVYRFAGLLYWINNHIPGGAKHVNRPRSRGDVDIHGVVIQSRPHLSFTRREERSGQEAIRELGVPEGTPFVCFTARDQSYNDTVFATEDSGEDWSYHEFRNCDIANYLPAAEEMVGRGSVAIRMGSVVKDPLKTTNPKIIDYANNGRTDFLDIYLGAKCKFFLSCGTGIDAVPQFLFRRPLVYANYIPMEILPTWNSNLLFIPKRLWLREEGRFMTFREIFGSGVAWVEESLEYEKLGIEVQENTPQEITHVAIEMDERINGTWQTSKEDEDLHKLFWSYFKPSEVNRVFKARIGTEFLRQNQELLV